MEPRAASDLPRLVGPVDAALHPVPKQKDNNYLDDI